MQSTSERCNSVNSECCPSYHPCSTWHFVRRPRTALKKNLHILFSSSPPPAHCLRHLVSCISSSDLSEHQLLHIIWDEKITGGAECLYTQKKNPQINHWKLNQGIYSPILSFAGFLTAQELILDDGWLLFTLQNLTFILRGFVSCAHSHYSLDAHSFTPRQSELSVLSLWVICKNVHICERCFEVQRRPLGIARGTAIKRGTSGFLDVRRQWSYKICIETV